jgi:PAS domain S-box-containing protein
MKVRTKLTIGFLVVVLLIWVTVFFAANTYTNIHEEFEALEEDIIPGAISMSEMVEKAQEIRAWTLVYSLRGNVVIMDKPIKEWLQETTTSLEELAREHREHETPIGLEEQKDAEELEDRVKQLNSAVVELINLKDQGTEIDELKEKMKESFALNFPPLLEQLEKHKAAHMEELAAAEEAVHESETSGRQVLFLTAGLITLLAVAVAWFTARLIVEPLHALHKGTEIIGQGNLDYRVGTKAKDEIGQLSRAFDQMTEDLLRTTTSIDKLNKEITERKQMEKALRESEEKWRSLTGNTDDTIIVTDNNKVIRYINRTIPPTTPKAVIGKTIYEYLSKEHHNIMRESLKKVYKTREPDSYEVAMDMSKFQPEIGTLWFRTKVVPIKTDKEVVGVIMIASDITERKRAEHNLKERVKELECLYRISKIDENPDITLDELYEEVARVLPASWQYPEITCSRVTIDGKEFETENCRETEWKLSSDIRVRGAKAGEVEVSYLEERPELDEGPFLKEEHLLIDAVAQRLGRITERKQMEEQIKASLAEKELLLKEVHHRVKNNMQIISSLLKLQAGGIEDNKTRELFNDSQNRIKSMALVYNKLYQSMDLAKIDLKDYVSELSNGLIQSYRDASGKITTEIEGDNIPLGVDLAIPCGLFINELISNSLKYAFPNGGNGEIRVSLRETDENNIEIIVSDNGVGIPDNVDLANTNTLGLYLVTMLVENQLGGKVELERNQGTKFRITFNKNQ